MALTVGFLRGGKLVALTVGFLRGGKLVALTVGFLDGRRDWAGQRAGKLPRQEKGPGGGPGLDRVGDDRRSAGGFGYGRLRRLIRVG